MGPLNTPLAAAPTEIPDVGMQRERRQQRAASAPSDEVLFDQARHGDGAAWQDLVERHTPVLWSVARSYRLGDADTADAVQVTWLRCVEHADRIHAPDRLRAWLLTTCRRECLRLGRLRARHVPDDPTNAAGILARLHDTDGHGDPERVAVHEDSCARLRQAMADLPAGQRDVVHALLGSTATLGRQYVEIAALLDRPVGSLGPTRQRGLRTLRSDRRIRDLRA